MIEWLMMIPFFIGVLAIAFIFIYIRVGNPDSRLWHFLFDGLDR